MDAGWCPSRRGTHHLVDMGEIEAGQMPRDINVADLGTHYFTQPILKAFEKWCRVSSTGVSLFEERSGRCSWHVERVGLSDVASVIELWS